MANDATAADAAPALTDAALQPGPAADLAFAKAVGLKCYGVRPHDPPILPCVLESGTLEVPVLILMRVLNHGETWHPSADTGQALEWAAKWLRDQGYEWDLGERSTVNKHWPELIRFQAWKWEGQRAVEACGPSIALAVVRGVLLVARELPITEAHIR